MVQDEDEIMDTDRYLLMESMDKIANREEKTPPRKSAPKKPKTKEPHPSEVAGETLKQDFDRLKIGVKDSDPKLYNPIYAPKEIFSKQSPCYFRFHG